MRLVIVGRGRVGRGLTRALRDAGLQVTLRSTAAVARARIEADAVLLAVPDDAIASVAAVVSERTSAPLLHCAGARGVEAFGDLQRPGLGGLHPLASFAATESSPTLRGASFAIVGDRPARRAAKEIVRRLGGRALQDVHGARYHAAAALVANGAAALATVGVDVLGTLGVKRPAAQHAMGALLRTVAENVERVGVPQALSGPIVRGDDATVRAHRAALLRPAREAYDQVAPTILAIAIRAGLPSARARAIRAALQSKTGRSEPNFSQSRKAAKRTDPESDE